MVKKHYTKHFLWCVFTILSVFTFPARAAQLLDEQRTVWQVDIMRSDAEKARGLMYRLYLHRWQGMIFLFDPPQEARFWMYHTYMPLAMSFYDAYGRLLTHYPYVPPCYSKNPANCPTYPAHGLVKYVLETRPANQNVRPPYAIPEPSEQLQHLLSP